MTHAPPPPTRSNAEVQEPPGLKPQCPAALPGAAPPGAPRPHRPCTAQSAGAASPAVTARQHSLHQHRPGAQRRRRHPSRPACTAPTSLAQAAPLHDPLGPTTHQRHCEQGLGEWVGGGREDGGGDGGPHHHPPPLGEHGLAADQAQAAQHHLDHRDLRGGVGWGLGWRVRLNGVHGCTTGTLPGGRCSTQEFDAGEWGAAWRGSLVQRVQRS